MLVMMLSVNKTFAHGTFHERIQSVTAKIEQDSLNAELYLDRGEMYRYHNEWQKALTDYDRAAALDSNLASVHLYRSQLMLENKKYENALTAIKHYLKQKPEDFHAVIIRARILGLLGLDLAAADDYAHALSKLAKPLPEYFIEHARILATAGDQYIDMALETLDAGTKRLGPVVTLQLFAIKLATRKKDYDGALSRLAKISSQSRRQEKWLLRRGEILLKAGQPEKALLSFNEALQKIEALPSHRRKIKAIANLESRLRSFIAQGIQNNTDNEKTINNRDEDLAGMPEEWSGIHINTRRH